MNQNERVLARLKEGTWLQMPEALHWSPPVTRLGARIHDLRHKFGHTIIERVACRVRLIANFKEISLPPKQNVATQNQMLF
jgi:hypothetical protein